MEHEDRKDAGGGETPVRFLMTSPDEGPSQRLICSSFYFFWYYMSKAEHSCRRTMGHLMNR